MKSLIEKNVAQRGDGGDQDKGAEGGAAGGHKYNGEHFQTYKK